MPLRTIIAAVSGGTANDGAVEIALRLAKRFSAHVEAFHVRVDPRDIVMMASDGFGMPVSGEWIDQLIADAKTVADKTKAAFVAAAGRHGLPLADAPRPDASASWREEAGYAPVLVADRARFFDLVVLGRSERVVDRPHSDTIEETLIRSGRPVLLAPAKAPDKLGEAIALGWNGAAEAVHVLSASLTLLAAARDAVVVTVGDDAAASADSVLEYLAWHGIKARHRKVAPVAHVGPGEQVLAEARDEGADLLVMGGYGHRPWRELLFGGATRQVVGHSLLPVLLAH
ncbi:MAG TPA: universal stress protein [Stellaceae bacterium]|nr:universal stress protein [Stellaceae bacterium]